MRFFLCIIFFINIGFAQYDVPITLLQQFNGKYGYTIIGNTHNEFDNWQDPPPPCQMLTQSNATLNLLPSQNVVAAYLIWSGIGDGNNLNVQLNGINQIHDLINTSDVNPPEAPLLYFSALKNITNYVQNYGNGLYDLTNFDLNSLVVNYCTGGVYFSGWNIIVVYEDVSLPNQQLNIYNGFRFTYNPAGVPIPIQIPITNLNVIDNQNAKMSYIAWNGSPNLFFQENIQFNNNLLSNALNPIDNPFNGTNSFTGSTNSWNMDIDTFDISPYINIGDTSANITMNSVAIRFIQTIITSIPSELPDASISNVNVSGQEICNNRNLNVNFNLLNVNANAPLPAGVPISLYANDSLLTMVLSTNSIPIGGQEGFSVPVSIPLAIPDTFNLRVVANDNGTTTGIIAESNPNNNEATIEVILNNPPIQPPVVNCWDNFVFNTSTCVWINTGSQPIQPPVVNCWDNFVFNPSTCAWENTGSQPIQPPVVNCWDNFIFNTSTCIWVNTGSQPIQPTATNCWDNFIFNSSTCAWENTGNQPIQPTAINCWDNFVFNTSTCVWINTGSQPIQPTAINCWDNFVFNTSTCAWENTGSQPIQPTAINCWDNFIFNNSTCAWVNIGSQPIQPTAINCWDNFVFNLSTCLWENTGSQPIQPTATNCWDNFVFNTSTCAWENTGSQPIQPTVTNCWDNFVFNTSTCAWENTGSQPIQPPIVNCWDNFVFNNSTCVWENTGSQPIQPTVTNCWDNFVFNTSTCLWENNGSQPIQPPIVNCWDNFVFNPSTCLWENTGNQPIQPTATNCWDNFVFNTSTCAWENTGSQPIQPTATNCWDNFVFNTSTCIWVNTGSQPIQPPIVNCWDNFVFNTSTCVWENIGSQPIQPPIVNCWDNFVFNNSTCAWENIGVQPEIPTSGICCDDFNFDNNTCQWLINFLPYFTPNGDGINDTWGIRTQKTIQVNIFDRYGKLIAILKNNQRWDGTYNGVSMPSSDYWFDILYDENKSFKGHFALKR